MLIPYIDIIVLFWYRNSLYWYFRPYIDIEIPILKSPAIDIVESLHVLIDIVEICMFLVFPCKTGSVISALPEKWTFLILKQL